MKDYRSVEMPDMTPPQDPALLGSQRYGKGFGPDLVRALTMALGPESLFVIGVVCLVIAPIYDYFRTILGFIDASIFAHTPLMVMVSAMHCHAMLAAAEGRRNLFPYKTDFTPVAFILVAFWRLFPGLAVGIGPLFAVVASGWGVTAGVLALVWALVTLPVTMTLAGVGWPLSALLGARHRQQLFCAPAQWLTAAVVFDLLMVLSFGAGELTLFGMSSLLGYAYAFVMAFMVVVVMQLTAFGVLGLYIWANLDDIHDTRRPMRDAERSAETAGPPHAADPQPASAPRPQPPTSSDIDAALLADAKELLKRDA